MHVFNTNTGITSTNTTYPTLAAKIGEYYWDGTGWVALAAAGSQNSPVQVKVNTTNQSVAINSANNILALGTVSFDVGNNKSGNTIVLPSSGLYDISGYASWVASGGVGGGWGLRLFNNGAFLEQFDGGPITYGISDAGSGRVLARLNAGDVLSLVMLTQQTSGTFSVNANSTFTVIKISD